MTRVRKADARRAERQPADAKKAAKQKAGESPRQAAPWGEISLYGLSFLLPVVVLLFILKSRGFYPFGDKTLFIMDMRDQYLEFFASLRDVVSGDDSIFLSWSRSMGGNYLGLFAYYLASPLSFITIFFPVRKLPDAIVLLTLLKIGLAGASFARFAVYLRKRTAQRAECGEWGLWAALMPAVCYALISYNMVYSMCLMWLDGVILLPLVLLGVEKILDGGGGGCYAAALAASFVCNYYTGYMVGIFTAIYAIYRILCGVKGKTVREYAAKGLRLGVCTLLAAGISAPLLVPVARDLMQGKLASASYRPDTEVNFLFADLFGKLKNGVYDSITNSGLPSIYCGYAALFLALAFFLLRRVTVREKVGAALILAFLAGSFYYTDWDIAWHGFRYPLWFPYRYAFVCSFFLLYMALRALGELGELCGLDELCEPGELGKLGELCEPGKLRRWQEVSGAGVVLVSVGVLTALSAADLGVNGKAMFAGLEGQFGYGTVADYEAFLDKTQPLVELVKGRDDGFYRINQGYEYSKNDAMLLGYHGMTHYSSTFHAAVNQLMPKLGIAQAHIWNSGYGSNPLLDSLFAVRYILEDGEVPAEYSPLGESGGGAAAYGNPYALPIAYSAPCTDLEPYLNSADPYANQNQLLNAVAGTDRAYFTEYAYDTAQTAAGWAYTFTADSGNPVYLYMKPFKEAWANVYVNGTWAGNYFSTETDCSLYLGNFLPGEQVVVEVAPSGEAVVAYAFIAQLHMDLLEQTLNGLNAGAMTVEKHGNGRLSGRITVGSGERIVTSIPYDSGWTVKVDGRKVEPVKFADTFLAVEAESGGHRISFSYVSPGFWEGMLISAGSLLAAGVYVTRGRRFRQTSGGGRRHTVRK